MQISNPKISIIIPVYNTERYLDACIRSIIEQAFFFDTEVLLVDNNSTDQSIEICNKYVRKYKNIQLLHQLKKGVSSARNLGLSEATGKYVMFIDSDDYIASGALKRLFLFAEAENADMICFNLYMHFATGKDKSRKLGIEYKTNKNMAASAQLLYTSLFQGDGYQGYVCNKMYRRSVIQNVRFRENISFMEDFIYNLDVIPLVSRVFFLPDSLYFYRQRADSLVHSKNSVQKQAYFKALKIIQIKLPKKFSSVSVLMEKNALLDWSSQLMFQDMITVKKYRRLFRELPETNKQIEKVMFNGPKGLAMSFSKRSFWVAVGLFVVGRLRSKFKKRTFSERVK